MAELEGRVDKSIVRPAFSVDLFSLLPKRLLALGCSVLLTLGLAEFELRMFNYRPGTMDSGMYTANQNQLLPYKLRPNYSGYCAGSEVRTDAQGYRVVTPNYSALRPTQNPERVVLLLGDSGVFGFGLKDQDTIASQMQHSCIARDLNYEIRNIGVSGYTSWNEYQSLMDYLKADRATEVVLLYMPNDLTFDNDYFGFSRGKLPSFSREDSRLHDLTHWLYSHVYITYFVSDGLKRVAAGLNGVMKPGTAESSFDEKAKQPALNYSLEALDKIKEICRERKIKFLVGIYRDVAFFDDPVSWLQYEDFVERNLDQHGIEWFIAKSHTDKLQPREIRVAWNDPHPSQRAAGLIAEDILSAVRTEGRLP